MVSSYDNQEAQQTTNKGQGRPGFTVIDIWDAVSGEA